MQIRTLNITYTQKDQVIKRDRLTQPQTVDVKSSKKNFNQKIYISFSKI